MIQASYYGDGTSQILSTIALSNDESRVYVAGQTGAAGPINLPSRTGAVQPAPGGGLGDTFVAIFSPDLQTIERSTYHGGSQGNERVQELLVDPVNGEVILTGESSSPDLPMPGNGAIQSKPNPSFSQQAAITRFAPDLTARVVATWFGGTDSAGSPQGMALDPATGDIYLTGGTGSTDLPATGFQQSYGGGSFDAYVARFSNDLSQLLGATYFGGSGDAAQADLPRHIVVHPLNGDVYIAGKSNSADLPGLAGANQESVAFPSQGDGVLARISADLSTLIQATYFGDASGATSEVVTIALNANASEVYIAGITNATNLAALGGGAQTAAAGTFVSRMDFTLTQAGPGTVTVDAVTQGTALGPLTLLALAAIGRRTRRRGRLPEHCTPA